MIEIRQHTSPSLGAVLKMALLHGVEEVVVRHINGGGNVNLIDSSGQSALMLAAASGHVKICRLLIEAGADMACRDTRGRDAVSIALDLGHTEVANLLREGSQRKGEPQTAQVEAHSDSVSDDFDEEADTAGWEEAADSEPPATNSATLLAAHALQDAISSHVPTDTDAEWTDLDIELPQHRPPAAVPKSRGRKRQRPRLDLGPLAAKIWPLADEITRRTGRTATLFELMTHAATSGLSFSTLRDEYVRWCTSQEADEMAAAFPVAESRASAPSPVKDPFAHVVANWPSSSASSSKAKPKAPSRSGKTRAAQTPGPVAGRPLLTSWAARIWAAADDISARKRSDATLTELLLHPFARSLSSRTVATEYDRWREHRVKGSRSIADARRDSSNSAIPTIESSPLVAVSARVSHIQRSDWAATAKSIAANEGLLVKDMRPMNGYFWVLVSTVNTGKLRAVARTLIELDFEHVNGHGFRRK